MNKKALIVLALVILVFGIYFIFNDEQGESKVEELDIYSTLQEENVAVYSSESSKNSYYFLVLSESLDVEKVQLELEFDKNVSYEVNYENIKERDRLPIEYYLVAETEFDFSQIDQFKKYLSDVTLDTDYEKNDEFDSYIEAYEDDEYYQNYLKNYNMHIVEIKLINPVEKVNLSKIDFVTTEEVDEEVITTVFRSEEVDVDFINVAKSSNKMYKITSQPYVYGEYFDGMVKYSLELSCLQDVLFDSFEVDGHKIVDINAYKNDFRVENFACKSGTDIVFEIVYEDDCEFCSDAQIIEFNANKSAVTHYTPQIFAPYNLMLIKSEDVDVYSSYFEYVFYSK